uniref:Uncharacterized protein n=1 Tax=Mycena chlorophos TaxID=658473 RepID=A0ABQ0L6Q9_MYCCL|nr:predicted protein [Mycena chlorophos]
MPYPTPLIHDLNMLFEPTNSPALAASPASSTSTLAADEDELPSKLDLNPHAAPFVPNSVPISLSPPRRHSVSFPKLPPKPVWFDAFAQGTRASSTPIQPAYATAVVTSRQSWPIEAMAELAQNFCWRAGEKVDDESPGIAPFALAVSNQFFHVFGEEPGQLFKWHLCECVVGAFIVSWDPDISSRAITYRNAPSFNYVASALAQAGFIGQLYQLVLVSGPYVSTCIVTLLRGLNSYEHIEALRALLTNAGPNFWHESGEGNATIHRFVAKFLEAVAPLRPNMSVLGRFLKPNDMGDIIKEVEQLVSKFAV